MSRKLIALDAGHGKNTYTRTGGKGVPGMAEFEFNSAVVGFALAHFERNGFDVILTQQLNGNDVPLRKRTELANYKRADLLLSFHADANANKDARGHWAFYWHTSNNGKRLADLWYDEVAKVRGNRFRSNQPSKPGSWTNFHMVRETIMPAVLMEHGFMTNVEDLALLKSDEYRQQCAEAACKAVCRYYNILYIPEIKQSFTDIPQTHWAYVAIEDAKENDIINGFTDGTFRPNEPVTRAQLAQILYNSKGDDK